jgi:hypothetical protein
MSTVSLRRIERHATAAAAAEVPVRGRRRPALIAAGVAMVGIGALSSASLVGQAGHRTALLAIARPVEIGQTLTDDDLTVARVPADPALQPIPVTARVTAVGRVAAVELRPGTLLTAGQLTDAVTPRPGEQLVPIPLAAGRLPARGLHPGDRVLITPVPAAQGDDAPAGEPVRARVVDVGDAADDGTTTVDVVVSASNGVRVSALGAAGRAALVLLPASG